VAKSLKIKSHDWASTILLVADFIGKSFAKGQAGDTAWWWRHWQQRPLAHEDGHSYCNIARQYCTYYGCV